MKAKNVVGKRVAKVVQTWVNDGEHPPGWEIERIVFTDGSIVSFSVNEHIDEYGVTASYWKPAKQEKPK